MLPLLLILASNFMGPMQGLTTKDELVALTVVEPSTTCGPAKTHVEVIDVQSGKSKLTLTEWTNVLGELSDGAIVVTSQTRTAGPLTVGVLERGSGRKRYSCSVQLVANTGIEWQQSREGLRGMTSPDGVQTLGIQVSLDANACVLTQKGPGGLTSLALPLSVTSTGTAPKISFEGTKTYADQVARRDGKVLWSRRVQETRPPCPKP